jgi:hypothetical protein
MTRLKGNGSLPLLALLLYSVNFTLGGKINVRRS